MALTFGRAARRCLAAGAAALVLIAAAGFAMPAPAQAQTHPLCAERKRSQDAAPTAATAGVCRIVDARGATDTPQVLPDGGAVEALVDLASDADFTLLGEVHDNPLHHRLRGAVVARLVQVRAAAGQPMPAVVMEHIRTDQQPALDRFAELRRDPEARGSAEDLLGFLEWDASGWPDQAIFEPLFRELVAARVPILPGDAAREAIRAVARQGVAALDEAMRKRLGLAEPLPAPLADALASELKESHCNLMPEAAIAPMSLVQRFRDAHLADAMVRAAGTHGAAVLLAGNGHVRADRGVPHSLRRMAPARPLLSVMLIEVEDGKTEAAAYLPRDPDGKPAVDIVVFTPRHEREDPCEALRRRMMRPKPPDVPAPKTPQP